MQVNENVDSRVNPFIKIDLLVHDVVNLTPEVEKVALEKEKQFWEQERPNLNGWGDWFFCDRVEEHFNKGLSIIKRATKTAYNDLQKIHRIMEHESQWRFATSQEKADYLTKKHEEIKREWNTLLLPSVENKEIFSTIRFDFKDSYFQELGLLAFFIGAMMNYNLDNHPEGSLDLNRNLEQEYSHYLLLKMQLLYFDNRLQPYKPDYLLDCTILENVHDEFNGEFWEEIDLDSFKLLFDIKNTSTVNFKIKHKTNFYALLWKMQNSSGGKVVQKEYIQSLLKKYGGDFDAYQNRSQIRKAETDWKVRALMKRMDGVLTKNK